MREKFLKDFLDILVIKNMFKMIRAINRTDSRSIWTRLGEDIDHIGKNTSTPTLKKIPISVDQILKTDQT